MSAPIHNGACMCGGITFSIRGQPSEVGNCFCRDCQKNAGGPFQTYAVCSVDQITVNDPYELETIWEIDETASGCKKEKHFCKRCGCTLWTVLLSVGKGVRVVRVSLIEHGLEMLVPRVELFTKLRPPFIPPVPNAKQCDAAS